MKKFFKIIKITIITFLFLIIASGIGFIIYANIYYHAEDVDNYITSDEYVTVTETNKYISFMPNENKATAGFILYPGAKVEEKAYAELMYDLAKMNIFAAIVKMPLRFAFFNANGANDILKDYSDKVDYFYIGGHSLGGAIASSYLKNNQDKFQGIIFLASYSMEDLSDSDVWSLSIYGSNDYVLNRNNYAKAKELLPKKNFEYEIDGGNHGYFASYGEQSGDGEATITRESQINLTVLKMIEFIGLKQLTLIL